ncbi:MAG: hypothetical protein R3321_01640 [Nitrososphaeraceae archaeon]|nr:hypothetical protein [Nitrososphaeraceae archaeon]
MIDRTQLKEELLELAEDTLATSKESLTALRALIPESSVKDLNTLYNNSLKNHKTLLSQILEIEKQEREEKIHDYNETHKSVDLSKYNLE